MSTECFKAVVSIGTYVTLVFKNNISKRNPAHMAGASARKHPFNNRFLLLSVKDVLVLESDFLY